MIAGALPFVTGVLFYAWLEASPKSWAGPKCGVPDWALLAFVLVVFAPSVAAQLRGDRHKRTPAAAAAPIAGALLLTTGSCVVAFLVWSTNRMCFA
jgi:hypothetical protein